MKCLYSWRANGNVLVWALVGRFRINFQLKFKYYHGIASDVVNDCRPRSNLSFATWLVERLLVLFHFPTRLHINLKFDQMKQEVFASIRYDASIIVNTSVSVCHVDMRCSCNCWEGLFWATIQTEGVSILAKLAKWYWQASEVTATLQIWIEGKVFYWTRAYPARVDKVW